MWLYKKLWPQTGSFSVILWVEFCSVSCDIYLLASSYFFSVWWGGRGKCFNRFFSVQFVFLFFFFLNQINRQKKICNQICSTRKWKDNSSLRQKWKMCTEQYLQHVMHMQMKEGGKKNTWWKYEEAVPSRAKMDL